MEYVSILFILFLILLIVAICVGFIKIIKILKAKYSQGDRKEKIRFIIIFISVILALVMAVVICYNITHKHWIETTNNLKENYPEISSISFDKPTPTLYIGFYVNDTVDYNGCEEIFLNEFDTELLDELIKNTDSNVPSDIMVSFISDSDKKTVAIDFNSGEGYTEWRCTYPLENNILYGKEYKLTFE